MATKLPAAFRLKRNVVELIERLATDTSTNKVDVVERSVELLDAQLNDAGRRAHVDLAELRRRYGKARMVIGVAMKDGEPVAGLTIDGKAPKDVHARAYADLDGGEVHVLLELGGREGEHPRLAKIGDEPLFLAPARFPVGSLPWPPKAPLGIVIDLADVPEVEARDAAVQPA